MYLASDHHHLSCSVLEDTFILFTEVFYHGFHDLLLAMTELAKKIWISSRFK
jgi:hypothetical protein